MVVDARSGDGAESVTEVDVAVAVSVASAAMPRGWSRGVVGDVPERGTVVRLAAVRESAAAGRDAVGAAGAAGTVSTTWTSMVALPVTRSVRALPRACSMLVQVPAATRSWASRSMAAHAAAASSLGKVPCHSSTPGSATHRRSPVVARARFARSRTRSGEMRCSSTRVRRRSVAASSPRCPARAATMASATSAGATSSSNATTPARYPSSCPAAIASCSPTQPAGLGHVAVVGRHRHPTRGQAHRLLDAALGLGVRRPDHRRDEVGGVEGRPDPARARVSPRVPSSHQTLSRRAASAMAASCTAVRVLISDWQSPTTPATRRGSVRTPARRAPRRPGAHPPTRPRPSRTGAGGGGRIGGADDRSLLLVRCDHVSPFPCSSILPPSTSYRTSVRIA